MEWASLLVSAAFSLASLLIAGLTLRLTTRNADRDEVRELKEALREVFRVKGGHIGIMAGSGAEKTTWPHIDQWLGARSD